MKQRKRNYNYLKNLKDELQETSEKYDIPVDDLMEMIDEMFYNIRKLITSKKVPRILLQSFGKFEPSYKKINYLIRRFIKLIREPDQTDDKKELYKQRISTLWPLKQRRIAEKRGIRTWYCWRDLPDDLSGYEECHKVTESNCNTCKKEIVSEDVTLEA